MKTIHILSFSLFVLVLLDIVLTAYGLEKSQNIKELNPLYSLLPFTINNLIKITLVVVLILLLNKAAELSCSDISISTFINVLALALNLVYLCVVINNIIIILIAS
jgi:hypothetical protein